MDRKKREGGNGRRRMRFYLYLFLFTLLCVLGTSNDGECTEAGMSTVEEIRVGLKSKYANRQSIILYNESLKLGYCNGRVYKTEKSLYSESGIEITPEKGLFFTAEGSFTLQAAEERVAQLCEAGVVAFPVFLSEGTVGIYFPVAENGATEKAAYEACEAAGKECGIAVVRDAKTRAYLIRIAAGTEVLLADGENGDYPQFVASETNEDGILAVDLGTNSYRGRIEIGRYGGRSTVTAVNVVPLEEYLYGVVPCEMPASWQMEALKAQAVCARSYALVKAGYHAETDIKRGYRMVDTVQSQMYGGISYEQKRSTAAVNATKGKTLCYENRTVTGYYFAASGGHTENVSDVWGISIPYLRGVPDIYETNPSKKPWGVTLSVDELKRLLLSAGEDTGTIKKVMQEIVTSSGRVYSLRIIGSFGSVGLETDTLRNVLELASTKFQVFGADSVPDTVTIQGVSGTKTAAIHDCYVMGEDGQVRSADGLTEQYVVLGADNMTSYPRYAPEEGEYLFAGMGSGHGVGMSQSGANGMAEEGFTYTEILEHYFTGISVR